MHSWLISRETASPTNPSTATSPPRRARWPSVSVVIRNEYGTGHGRAHQPNIRDEMVDLALDGGLTWVRWALRRLGYFSEGRPDALIRDLVEQPQTNFRAGTLDRRLKAADMPRLEQRHQRALGVAVGQRVMRGTFVVRWGGLDPCLNSDDTETWPPAYRLGLAQGLWFAPDDRPTVTAGSIRDGLTVLDPLPDCSDELDELIGRIITETEPGLPNDDLKDAVAAARFVRDRVPARPAAEAVALSRLAEHIEPRQSATPGGVRDDTHSIGARCRSRSTPGP